MLRHDGKVEDAGDFSDFYIKPAGNMPPRERKELQQLQDEVQLKVKIRSEVNSFRSGVHQVVITYKLTKVGMAKFGNAAMRSDSSGLWVKVMQSEWQGHLWNPTLRQSCCVLSN